MEDLSIGVEAGADEYMFGRVVGLGTTDDRVYVADRQLFAIRVYDLDGNHLFDFGSEGHGPGEFDSLARFAVDPEGDRVLVQGNARISVFDLDGRLLDTWRYRRSDLADRLVVGESGATHVPSSWLEHGRRRSGFIVVSPEGVEQDRIEGPRYDRLPFMLPANGPDGQLLAYVLLPYAPLGHWTLTASGALVAGAADSYSFSVTRSDRKLVIERRVSLAEVPSAEVDWQVASATSFLRRSQQDWSWNGPPIPERVPPYKAFLPDRYGRIWVLRQLGFEHTEVCDQDPASVGERPARPCYQRIYGFDAFAERDGRFLGQVRLPSWFRSPGRISRELHWAREAMWGAVEDEAGTIMVKRYRLVLPGEE